MGIRIASDTRPVQVSGSANEGRSRSKLARNELIPGSRYLLKRWIGEGGMGVIYEAEHVDVKRPVAVKVLRPEYATNLSVIEAFRFEARATSELDSPYLVKIHDYFELPDGRSALVMELLEGADLSRRTDSVLSPVRVIGIARQVCKALQLVHDSGIVHRDLKPENIFVCENEDRPDTIRVLDFGIARLAAQATSAQSGGTPMYTAPEVVLGGAQGPRADIYALGCVLYELLTGRTAFGRDTIDETLQAHLDSPPPPPSTHASDIHPKLDAVVQRALAREPEDRYADMAALEAALCEAQIAAGLTTEWDDLPLPTDIPADQHKRLVAAMPDPSHRRSPSRLGSWAVILATVALTATGVFALTRPDTDPTAALSPEQIEARNLAREARTAGSRAAWVYPPPDDVSARTAYQAVLALEDLGELGNSTATELRADFSTTLIRLGDEYWDADGGTRFAIAYYEQALLFERTSLHALERSSMALSSLNAFAVRAANSQFALEELVRVEPLVELAAQNSEPVAERIDKVRRRRRVAPSPRPERPKPSVAPAEKLEAEGRPTAASPAVESTTDGPPDTETRDPEGGKKLVKQGQAAANSGGAGKAKLLFERALAKDSRNASAHAGLRDLAFSAGDYARAVRHGKRAATLAPRNAAHQLRLGDAYYRTHKYVQAQSAYSAASRLGDERATWRLERAREKLGG